MTLMASPIAVTLDGNLCHWMVQRLGVYWITLLSASATGYPRLYVGPDAKKFVIKVLTPDWLKAPRPGK